MTYLLNRRPFDLQTLLARKRKNAIPEHDASPSESKANDVPLILKDLRFGIQIAPPAI